MYKRLAALTLFLLASALEAAEVDVDLLAKTQWKQLESENFIVVTDARTPRAKAMVAELERFRAFMFAQFDELLTENPQKMPMVLVENTRRFAALGVPAGYAGVFAKSEHESSILAAVRGFSRARQGEPNWGRTVVLHELVHYLIQQSPFKAATTPWFDEGLAEYFSTYLEDHDQAHLGDSTAVLKRIHSMIGLDEENPAVTPEVINVEALFKTSREALQVVDASSQAREAALNRFYGRSLAVVHYLHASSSGRQQLLEYLHLTAAGESVDEAFRQAFGASFSNLDQQVANYLQQGDLRSRSFALVESHDADDVRVISKRLRRRDALEFIVPKISAFPDSFLGAGNREKLNARVEALYPDFFRS